MYYSIVKNIIDPSIIEFEADFAPFQPKKQKAINGVATYQFSHTNDIVAHSEKIEGLFQYSAKKYDTKTIDPFESHGIASFWNEIKNLPGGKYKVENGKIISQ